MARRAWSIWRVRGVRGVGELGEAARTTVTRPTHCQPGTIIICSGCPSEGQVTQQPRQRRPRRLIPAAALLNHEHASASTTPSQPQEEAQEEAQGPEQGVGCWASSQSYQGLLLDACGPAKALIRGANGLKLWLKVTRPAKGDNRPWPALVLPDLTAGRDFSATNATHLPSRLYTCRTSEHLPFSTARLPASQPSQPMWTWLQLWWVQSVGDAHVLDLAAFPACLVDDAVGGEQRIHTLR